MAQRLIVIVLAAFVAIVAGCGGDAGEDDDGAIGLQFLRLAEDEEPDRAVGVLSTPTAAAGHECQERDKDGQPLSHCDPLYSVRNQRCATRNTATTGAVATTAPASRTG